MEEVVDDFPGCLWLKCFVEDTLTCSFLENKMKHVVQVIVCVIEINCSSRLCLCFAGKINILTCLHANVS